MKRFLSVILLGIVPLICGGCHSRQEWSGIFMKKGREYAAKGKHELAAAEYEKAVQIDRNNQQAYLEMAEVYLSLSRVKMAVEMFNAAQIASSSPIPLRYELIRGGILESEGDFWSAREAYRKALKQDPQNSAYRKKVENLDRLISRKEEPST